MRKQLALSIVASGVIAAFAAAPVANAAPPLKNGLWLVPTSKLRPGDSTEVGGICNEPGFKSRKLESPVLEPAEVFLNTGDAEAPSLIGRARVKKDANPGRYTVSFVCEGARVTTTITVVSGTKPPKPSGQVKVTPRGAADTGGGY